MSRSGGINPIKFKEVSIDDCASLSSSLEDHGGVAESHRGVEEAAESRAHEVPQREGGRPHAGDDRVLSGTQFIILLFIIYYLGTFPY